MTPKRHRLQIVGPLDRVPRQIRAWSGGAEELALVINPRDKDGVLVLVRGGKKLSAVSWHGKGLGDAPGAPATELTVAAAVDQVKLHRAALSKRAADTTLRGQWSGTFTMSPVPSVELVRKIAPYVTITITSTPAGWVAAAGRTKTWYSPADRGGVQSPVSSLVDAVDRALLLAKDLVAGACSTRDTTRRAAIDPAYAAKHPSKPAVERPDVTERIGRARPAPPEPTPTPTPTPTKARAKRASSANSVEPDAKRDQQLLELLTASIRTAMEAP